MKMDINRNDSQNIELYLNLNEAPNTTPDPQMPLLNADGN